MEEGATVPSKLLFRGDYSWIRSGGRGCYYGSSDGVSFGFDEVDPTDMNTG